MGEIEPPSAPDGWVEIEVRAAALNHHDVWSLRGVGLPADRLPMILGCDAAGVTADGREVVVHAVINDPGYVGADGTYDPRRSLLSERYPGHVRRTGRVPPGNLVDKPAELSFAEAACLPTAWLTAYRMLFTAVRRPARRHGAGPGRRRGSGHRADRCWPAPPACGSGSPRATRPAGRAVELGARPGLRLR